MIENTELQPAFVVVNTEFRSVAYSLFPRYVKPKPKQNNNKRFIVKRLGSFIGDSALTWQCDGNDHANL